MRAPNPAESLSPFPNTQTANQIFSPASPEVRTPHRLGRAIGRASVVLTTISLASIGAAAAGSEPTHNNAGESRASAASDHRLDNVTRVAHESQNIYTGRVTITTSRRIKAEREPSINTAQSDGVTVGKIMGIPAANITQGKNTEVSIGGRTIDLADYTSTHRKTEAWTDSRTGDCLWNYAIQDIGVASKKAGLDAKQTEAAMKDAKNIKRVMAGYITDNPELKANPNLVLTGKEYVAKHAREEADELVTAMRAAQSPDTKPAPPATAPKTAKPDPDTKVNTNPVHTAPRVENKTDFKEVALSATKVLSKSLLAIAALVGVAGGILGLRRRHRRRQEEAAAEAAASSPTGKHRPPDGSGEPEPTDDFSDLRKITEDDEKHGRDPIDPPTDARTVGTGLGRSPYAPPAGSARATVLHAAPTAPDDIRARFGAPRLIEKPIDRRRLRSVPVSGSQNDTVVSIRRAFAQAPPPAEANIKDAITDPAAAPVIPLTGRRPLEGRGRLPDGRYVGMHRKISYDDYDDSPISAITVHRSNTMADRTVPVTAVS